MPRRHWCYFLGNYLCNTFVRGIIQNRTYLLQKNSHHAVSYIQKGLPDYSVRQPLATLHTASCYRAAGQTLCSLFEPEHKVYGKNQKHGSHQVIPTQLRVKRHHRENYEYR